MELLGPHDHEMEISYIEGRHIWDRKSIDHTSTWFWSTPPSFMENSFQQLYLSVLYTPLFLSLLPEVFQPKTSKLSWNRFGKMVHTDQQKGENLLAMKWNYRQERWLTLVIQNQHRLSYSWSYPLEWLTVGKNHDVYPLFPKMDLLHKEVPTKQKNRPQQPWLAGPGSGGKLSLNKKRWA